MDELLEVKLAISLAGHDKGQLYLIVREDDNNLFLCDGQLRTLDKLKRKNKRHTQVIKKLPINVVDTIKNSSQLTNEVIKRAIKLYLEK